MSNADITDAGLRVAGSVIDRDEIADVLHEALGEAQRQTGLPAGGTSWWDAAFAADLLLVHIANTCSSPDSITAA